MMTTTNTVTPLTGINGDASLFNTTDGIVPSLSGNGGPLAETINQATAFVTGVADPAPTDVQLDQDPAGYIQKRIVSLIYWEVPARSAAVLGSLLFILRMTQYYSLLHLTAAIFTILTSLNFVYVNTHKQSQRVFGGRSPDQLTNPHRARLQNKQVLIPRDKVVRTAQVVVDVVEVAIQQVARLVLVEDNWKSGCALVASYLVWTLAAYIATKHLITLFLISMFSIPPIYHKHQVVIDKHVAQYTHQARVVAQQYRTVAADKMNTLYSQAIDTFAKKAPAPQQKTE